MSRTGEWLTSARDGLLATLSRSWVEVWIMSVCERIGREPGIARGPPGIAGFAGILIGRVTSPGGLFVNLADADMGVVGENSGLSFLPADILALRPIEEKNPPDLSEGLDDVKDRMDDGGVPLPVPTLVLDFRG
jgi:hypothetical protein